MYSVLSLSNILLFLSVSLPCTCQFQSDVANTNITSGTIYWSALGIGTVDFLKYCKIVELILYTYTRTKSARNEE